MVKMPGPFVTVWEPSAKSSRTIRLHHMQKKTFCRKAIIFNYSNTMQYRHTIHFCLCAETSPSSCLPLILRGTTRTGNTTLSFSFSISDQHKFNCHISFSNVLFHAVPLRAFCTTCHGRCLLYTSPSPRDS